ncbi:MAG: hypothetical protein QOH35_5596 [Acidobacteriaceae bacterium]|jgi:hypothetical protein|nr:hypothetical protein [Acidobacteriaceae bacterium]
MFVVMASEIVTLNLNYVNSESLKKKPSLVTRAAAATLWLLQKVVRDCADRLIDQACRTVPTTH